MRAYLSWMIKKVSPIIASATSSAISTASKTLSGIKASAVSIFQTIRKVRLTDRIPFLKGLFRALDPSTIIKLITSEKSSYVLRHSIYENIVYGISPVLLYKMIIRPGIKYLPFTDNSVSEYIIDTAAQLLFVRMAIKLMLNNTLYSASLSKAVYDEHLQSKHLPPCSCGSTTKIFSSLASTLYHTGKMTTVFCAETALDSVFPYGKKLLLPIRALVYGQAFLDSKLNNAGICSTHKNEIQNKNHEYTFGCGTSFLIFLTACEQLIYVTTGIQHPSISTAIFNIGMQYYTANMNLLDEPLPNNSVTVDYFKPIRVATRLTSKIIADEIVYRIKNNEKRTDWRKIGNQIQQFPPIQYLLQILIDKNLKNLHQFITQPATQVFLEINGDSITYSLEWIIALQQSNMTKRIMNYKNYIPNFLVSDTTKNIVTIIIDEGMNDFLEKTNEFISLHKPRNLKPFTIKLFTEQPMSEHIKESYVGTNTETKIIPPTPQSKNSLLVEINEDYIPNAPISSVIKTNSNAPIIKIVQK